MIFVLCVYLWRASEILCWRVRVRESKKEFVCAFVVFTYEWEGMWWLLWMGDVIKRVCVRLREKVNVCLFVTRHMFVLCATKCAFGCACAQVSEWVWEKETSLQPRWIQVHSNVYSYHLNAGTVELRQPTYEADCFGRIHQRNRAPCVDWKTSGLKKKN